MKVTVIVIDGLGAGEMPDAEKFGDVGSNTLKNVVEATGVKLPNLEMLGLLSIEGINLSNIKPKGIYGKLSELAPAKDTQAGHYEMMNVILKKPFKVYPNAFPEKLVKKLEKACKIEFIGNEIASGTEIISRLGNQSIKQKKAILYTSHDSVLQIACHNEVLSLEELYNVCEKARKVMMGANKVGRIIARPFTTIDGEFVRTADRHDYALKPPKKSIMVTMQQKGYKVVGIGKINDIFQGEGINESYKTTSNYDGLVKTLQQMKANFDGLLFVNLVETDQNFGHRNDVDGFAKALKEIDDFVPALLEALDDDDVIIFTGDHGNDPTTASINHSREYIPLAIYGKNLKSNYNLGTLTGFNHIGHSILDYFGIKKYNENIFIKK